MSRQKELADIRVLLLHKTGSAYLVRREDDTAGPTIWLPRSMVEVERDAAMPHVFIVTMPMWLAIEKELV